MFQGARWIVAVALAGVGLCGASAQAAIKIEQATVQNGVAFVKGNGAALGFTITWEGVAVTTANQKNGGFSFFSVLPDDCTGALSDGVSTVAVAVLGCTASAPAPVAKTGQTQCFDSSGISIPCSGTDQDGELQEGVASPSPRFTKNVNAADDTGAVGGTAGNGICDGTETCNGTITDNLTGLIWLQNANCANAGRDWATALSDVASLNMNGTMNSNNCSDTSKAGSHQIDWRLPNVRELHSLVDYGRFSPSLPASHPFTNFQVNYWSSTTFAFNPEGAWVVGFFTGFVIPDFKTSSQSVTAVRGGS
jgi:hypothetical protein